MLYGKIIDGQLVFARLPIVTDSGHVFPIGEQDWLNYGYKPVNYTVPVEQDGYHVISTGWDENETGIVQTWLFAEDDITENPTGDSA